MTITDLCDNCGERDASTREREDCGSRMCDPCWAAALEHGHRHGLHTDGTNDEPVEGCPLCVGLPTCDFCQTVGHDVLDCPNIDPDQLAEEIARQVVAEYLQRTTGKE